MSAVVCNWCGDGVQIELAIPINGGGYRHRNGECDYGAFEYHKMPNGSECWYRDSDHSYFSEVKRTRGKWVGPRDARVPGASTASKFAAPEVEQLMGFVARVERGDLKKYEELVLSEAEAFGVNMNQPKHLILRDAKGAIGTLTHSGFEVALDGSPASTEFDSVRPHLVALDRFFNDYQLDPLQAEAVVYSREHGFAGRFDARVRMRSLRIHDEETGDEMNLDLEPHTALIDVKTSSFIGRAYHCQLHAYDLAAEECGYGASDRLLILQTREDGTYRLWPCRSSRKAFLHALALYRAGKECDAATRKDYKELEKAA